VHVLNALQVAGVSSLSPFTTWSPDVTVMLQWCHRGFTVVSQRVTVTLQRGSSGVQVVLKSCYNCVPKVLQ
jgi:hypothetical protein